LERWRGVFAENTTLIEPDVKIDFPRDPKDAIFLECAVAAGADYLITGDKDFDSARKVIDTTVISISQFKRLVMDNWSSD
jgi:predicted nucleic acid-binding protein